MMRRRFARLRVGLLLLVAAIVVASVERVAATREAEVETFTAFLEDEDSAWAAAMLTERVAKDQADLPNVAVKQEAVAPHRGETRSKQKRCMFCKMYWNSTKILKAQARRNAVLTWRSIQRTQEDRAKAREATDNQLVRNLDEVAPSFDPHPRKRELGEPEIDINYDRNKRKLPLKLVSEFWSCVNEQSVSFIESVAMAAMGNYGLDIMCTNNEDDVILEAATPEEDKKRREQQRLMELRFRQRNRKRQSQDTMML